MRVSARSATGRSHAMVGVVAALVCALGADAQGASTPIRIVEGRELRSSALPALRLRVDSAFTFVGDFAFRIRDVAAGQRFIFADVREGTVRRMVIAQFESMLPSSQDTYRYSFDGAPLRAGMPFRENEFAFSHKAAATENPAGEAALTVRLLAAHGYHIADEVMTWRFVTVPDSARRHELIIFYVEPIAPSGVRLQDLYAGDEPTALWRTVARQLKLRAEKAFELRP